MVSPIGWTRCCSVFSVFSDKVQHLRKSITLSHRCPKMCLVLVVRHSLSVPKTFWVSCQNLVNSFSHPSGSFKLCHSRCEEFWCEHVVTKHFAFSCCLFVCFFFPAWCEKALMLTSKREKVQVYKKKLLNAEKILRFRCVFRKKRGLGKLTTQPGRGNQNQTNQRQRY